MDTSEIDINDFLQNPLKKLSTKDLERRIATALSEATGQDYRATISSIDYDHSGSETKVVLNIWKKLDLKWPLTSGSVSNDTRD